MLVRRLLLVVSVLASPVLSSWEEGDVGTDHMYNDIESFNLPSNSTLDCYNACGLSSECVGWVLTPSGRCGINATCYLKSSMGASVLNDCRISGFMPGTLLPPVFVTQPAGAVVTANGWLANELKVQAQGLTGHLALFWTDIQNSSWVGGTGDGGLHERTPYWLNGLVPLSYLLPDNQELATQRDAYLNYIMKNAAPSGWIGPDDMPSKYDARALSILQPSTI